MSFSWQRLGVAALLAVWFGFGTPAQAQFNLRTIPSAQQRNPINPYWQVSPGLTQTQYLSQVRAYARTAQQIPPWLYGYNPYPNPIYNRGPIYPTPGPLYSGGGYLGNSAANLYSPTIDPTGGNIYSPGMTPGYGGGYANPYSPYIDNYGIGSGGTLYGAADTIRAAGQLMVTQQQARQAYEQARQAKLETEKRKFDLDMYIKANTPTFTENQAKVAAQTLRRIQNNSNPAEIVSGKALNIIMDDLRRYPGKKANESTSMDPELLQQINVTSSFGSLGILRNGGKFEWPTALQELLSPEQQKAIEVQTQALVQVAMKGGRPDANVMRDLRGDLDKARDQLARKINEIPTQEYLEAKRFFNDFDEARIALERGEAKNQLAWNKFAASGPKTTQEVTDWMINHGLKFAPSTSSDEAAYRALYNHLAAFSVAMNTQFANAEKE